MKNITDDLIAEITPTEFELLVKSYLMSLGHELKQFKVIHNDKIRTHDGTYQIDVKAVFEALNVKFIVLIECKHHKSPIKRDVVQLLFDKIRSIGAHKGIIFATTNFQEGALEYAEKHGIALVKVIEGKYTYATKGYSQQTYNPPPWADIPKYVGEFKYNKTENGHSTSFLQKGNYDALSEFLFKK